MNECQRYCPFFNPIKDSLGNIKCGLQDGRFTSRAQKKACINGGTENKTFCPAIVSFAGKFGVEVPNKQEDFTAFLNSLAARFNEID